MDEENAVIIAGYGRFGQIAGRLLRSVGHGVTVLDVDADQVEVLRRFGQKVYYGDGSRLDLLRAAGAGRAKLLIVAVDEPAKALEIVHTARRHFPGLKILARARGRAEAYELLDLGIEGVYRETYDTSLRVGVDALRLLGWHGHRAVRAARTFRRYDEDGLAEMARLRHDQAALVTTARERIRELEEILQADQAEAKELQADPGWDADGLRAAAQAAPRPER